MNNVGCLASGVVAVLLRFFSQTRVLSTSRMRRVVYTSLYLFSVLRSDLCVQDRPHRQISFAGIVGDVLG